MVERLLDLYTSIPELEEQEQFLQEKLQIAIQAHDDKWIGSCEKLLKLIRERLTILKQSD